MNKSLILAAETFIPEKQTENCFQNDDLNKEILNFKIYYYTQEADLLKYKQHRVFKWPTYFYNNHFKTMLNDSDGLFLQLCVSPDHILLLWKSRL